MADEDLSLAPVGRPLVTVQTVISQLEKKWAKQDDKPILTAGFKVLTEWFDCLASQFELGDLAAT